jgi:hypothetical protein
MLIETFVRMSTLGPFSSARSNRSYNHARFLNERHA